MSAKTVPLIIGVDGLIGNAFWRFYQKIIPETSGTSRRGTDQLPFLDIREPNTERQDLSRFTHAIITAAAPNIRNCELNPKETARINVTGPLKLAKELLSQGIQPILFSTDYVFDGIEGGYTEEDAPNPLNEYGRQKAELEKKIEEVCDGNYLMIRLSKVLTHTSNHSNFLTDLAQQLNAGEKVFAAIDQIFSPISIHDVVDGVSDLIKANARGLYHLGGPEKWNRYELTKTIAKHLDLPQQLICPISLDELSEPFKRPKNTDLKSKKLTRQKDPLTKILEKYKSQKFYD